MTPWFADTAYFLAILNLHDQFHSRAMELSRLRHPMMTTRWVLAEVGDGLATPPRRKRFVDLMSLLPRRGDVRVLSVDDDQFERGVTLYGERMDKAWSLTDCMSFVVMRELGLMEALTPDHHFEQAGFVALLR